MTPEEIKKRSNNPIVLFSLDFLVTEKAFDAFVENLKYDINKIIDCLGRPFPDEYHSVFFSYAFIWITTPQGHDYWENLDWLFRKYTELYDEY